MASDFNPFVGQPIRSLQTYLRRISRTYETVPPVIPDGKFGQQTKDSVLGFQRTFNMEETGEVDRETWNKILAVYTDIIKYEGTPRPSLIYPGGKYVILPGEDNKNLYVIQSMMFVLSSYYENMMPVEINGTNDEKTAASVRQFQKIFGMQENGIIDKQFWDHLTGLYEAKVSQSRI